MARKDKVRDEFADDDFFVLQGVDPGNFYSKENFARICVLLDQDKTNGEISTRPKL